VSAVSDLHKRIVTGLYGQKCLALVYCTARPEPLSARTSGVLVYLRDGAAGVPVEPLADQTSADADRNRQWREVGVGAQILRDLGVSSICNLSSSIHDYKGLAGFGIEIVESEPFEG
jgi:3,4-dihydroxy 2-butanone 4-phosphate synthase/GTP cyclohydrolase II